jgi:light-regulated signal transduction histidine kinase (bacteriophytochrome)
MLQTDNAFRRLFAGNPLPMWLYDLESLVFIDVNDAAVAHYGYSRDEFLGMRIADLRVAGDPGRHRLRDGRFIDVEVSSQPLEYGGPPTALAVVHDVTASREAERARVEEGLRRLNAELEERVRQRTVQLQAAVDELEAFSYSVSHDLRAPLRSIDGFSQALVEDVGALLPPGAHQHIDRIRAATQRMAHLIDDLLTLSTISRTEMTRQPIDMTDLVGRVLAEMEAHVPRSAVVTIAPGMTTSGDPRLLRVVLENLLANALKFSGAQEQPCIDVGQTSRDGASQVFYVRDNGVGFDPAYADKLFRPFQRLHSSSEFPGTGIGLATVRRIVQRHGGWVWAEGRMGEGACFSFALEYTESREQAP